MDKEKISQKERLVLWRAERAERAERAKQGGREASTLSTMKGAPASRKGNSSERNGRGVHGGVLTARAGAGNVIRKDKSRSSKAVVQRKPFQVSRG